MKCLYYQYLNIEKTCWNDGPLCDIHHKCPCFDDVKNPCSLHNCERCKIKRKHKFNTYCIDCMCIYNDCNRMKDNELTCKNHECVLC